MNWQIPSNKILISGCLLIILLITLPFWVPRVVADADVELLSVSPKMSDLYLAQVISDEKQRVDVAFVGGLNAGERIRAAELEAQLQNVSGTSPTVYNFSQQETGVREQYAISRILLRHKKIKTLFFEVPDLSGGRPVEKDLIYKWNIYLFSEYAKELSTLRRLAFFAEAVRGAPIQLFATKVHSSERVPLPFNRWQFELIHKHRGSVPRDAMPWARNKTSLNNRPLTLESTYFDLSDEQIAAVRSLKRICDSEGTKLVLFVARHRIAEVTAPALPKINKDVIGDLPTVFTEGDSEELAGYIAESWGG